MDSKKQDASVLHLRSAVDLLSDGRRVRNEIQAIGEDGSQSQLVNINDGQWNLSYMPTEIGALQSGMQTGAVTIDSPATHIAHHDIDTLLPREIGRLVRGVSLETDPQLQLQRLAQGGRITFDIPRIRVTGSVDFDGEHRLITSRVDYPLYVEVKHFAEHLLNDGIDVPTLQVTAKAARGAEGQFVSGHLETLTISRVVINPELNDSDFTLAVPAGTLVQKFDGTDEVARIVTDHPIENLSAVAGDLASLQPLELDDGSNGGYWMAGSVLTVTLAIVVAFATILWSRHRRSV
jgi:hypothetical protein